MFLQILVQIIQVFPTYRCMYLLLLLNCLPPLLRNDQKFKKQYKILKVFRKRQIRLAFFFINNLFNVLSKKFQNLSDFFSSQNLRKSMQKTFPAHLKHFDNKKNKKYSTQKNFECKNQMYFFPLTCISVNGTDPIIFLLMIFLCCI